ncbi:MAG: Dabb family protein [Acidobacteria bacterium]|nr:Dabb family protein [Acidobacteriota bacterium]
MRNLFTARSMGLLLAGALLFGAGTLVGQKMASGKKTLIHAFAFKQEQGTTQKDLDAVWAATRKMAGQIPEIKSVWMGKVLNRGDQWQYGIVMEFENRDALKKYADHPAHQEWDAVYSKVRVEGTNTLDIQGQ